MAPKIFIQIKQAFSPQEKGGNPTTSHSHDPALKKTAGHKLPFVQKLEQPLEPESTPPSENKTYSGKMNPKPSIDELMETARQSKAKLDAAAPPAQIGTSRGISSSKNVNPETIPSKGR